MKFRTDVRTRRSVRPHVPEVAPPMRIALMGSRGVPARYGGFETAMEEVGRRLTVMGHDVTVYCRVGNSKDDGGDPNFYLGMRLVHLPAVRSRTLETLSHSFLSALHALVSRRYDAVVLCNCANAPLLPLFRLRRIPVAVALDGLEWKRAKWGAAGRRYYRVAEALTVRWAQCLIADARGISRYYEDEFGAETVEIAYGAPEMWHVGSDRLHEVGVEADGYHLIVARLEPENHVDMILSGYLESDARLPIVVVGSNPYPSPHTHRIEELAARSDKVLRLGGLWDQDLLDQLYVGARTYLHGHSVGGTNPSLLRALAGGTPVIAYDVEFNREVAREAGVYARTSAAFGKAIRFAETRPAATREERSQTASATRTRYSWESIAEQYADLSRRLATGQSHRGKNSGRRRHPTED